MTTLTKRQKEILDFIQNFFKKYGYSPTFREIGDNLGISSSATVHTHIENLRNKGYLKSGYNKGRSIELVRIDDSWTRTIELPLVGLIAAGEPIEAVENQETIAVPVNFVQDSANTYVLQVKGDSMVDEGILEGDFVIVERNPSPNNGDVVVALLNNAYAPLKKFYREKDRIRLQPATSKLKPIYTRDPLIQGVVKGVIRKFN